MIGVVIIAPNFLPLDSLTKFVLLIYDIILAIVFLLAAVRLDGEVNK